MIGNVVGSYKITEKIGEGGMGAVFKGVDLMLEREVAIKMLRPELASQPQVVERFRSEAVTLAKLNHPNIATLYSFIRQGEDFFMVMEYVEGETLDSLVRRTGAMECGHAISLFCQALEGIGRAHKLGIVHRDIKPANIMLMREDGSIKVMDFGIARMLGSARMTRQGNIVGTIEYMSPEAIQGNESDARSDIYSAGILLYEMVTGRVPFASDTEFGLMMAQIQEAPPPPRSFAPQIPEAVEDAIMRALAKNPAARFQTASEFRDALQKSLATSPVDKQFEERRPAVPPTRLGQGVSTNPAALKETRLGAANAQDEAPATRLGSVAGAQPAPAYYNAAQYGNAQPSAQGSPLSKLNWMHYAAAAVVLVAVIGLGFALVGGKKGEAVDAPATIIQPAAAAPAQKQADTPAPPAPVAEPLPGQTKVQPAEAVNVPSDNIARPREAVNQPKQQPKVTRKETDTAARERARKREEARRLLDQ